jgi:hypothetical protein
MADPPPLQETWRQQHSKALGFILPPYQRRKYTHKPIIQSIKLKANTFLESPPLEDMFCVTK